MTFLEWFDGLASEVGYEETLKYTYTELNSMYLEDYFKEEIK